MKRIVAFGLMALVLPLLSGCGGPDLLMKELIANLNTCAELMEKKESKEKVLAAIERTNATAEKLNKLKLSKEEQEELFKRHDDELKKVAKRLDEAQKQWKLEGREDLPAIVLEKLTNKK